MTFLYSTLSGPEHVPAQDASELLSIARGFPRWDALNTGSEPTHFLARSCGKRKRVARRGKRTRKEEDQRERTPYCLTYNARRYSLVLT